MEGGRNDRRGEKEKKKAGRYGSVLIHYGERAPSLISVTLFPSTRDDSADLLRQRGSHELRE